MTDQLARPGLTTLCYCWLITRTDGTQIGFTDHDATLEIGGIECLPQTGMTAGAMEMESGFSLNGAQAEAALSADAITPADILNGLYDRAKVQFYLVDWLAPESAELLRSMTITKVTQSDGVFSAEMDGLLSGFDAPQGRYFRRQCDASFGDSQCGIQTSDAAYHLDATLTKDSEGAVVNIAKPSADKNAFSIGTLIIAGEIVPIARIEESGALWRIHLRKLPAQAQSQGQSCTLTMGCDKSFATCKARFHNELNFRGFPHLPGNDAAYQFAKSDDVFDGGVVVP